MSKLDKYMNDPDIVNESMPLREVHAIRLMIWDEIKDMTPEERVAYYNDANDVIKEYSLERLVVDKAPPRWAVTHKLSPRLGGFFIAWKITF